MKNDLVCNIIVVFMVMIITNNLSKIALHVIVRVVLSGVTVANNLLDLFLRRFYAIDL